jgi:hypothetical protein
LPFPWQLQSGNSLCVLRFGLVDVLLLLGLAALTAASHVPSRKPPSFSTFSHSLLKGIPIYLTKYDRQAAFLSAKT